jgi:hypothetical protein
MDQFWLGKQPRKEVFIVADWFLFLEFTGKSQKAMFVHGPNIRSDTARLAPGCSTWAWYIKESLWEGYICRETYGSEPKVPYIYRQTHALFCDSKLNTNYRRVPSYSI